MYTQRLFTQKKKRRGGPILVLLGVAFVCVLGAAGFVAILGQRSGVLQTAMPQVREFVFGLPGLSPENCVIAGDALDCRAGASGQKLTEALAQMRALREALAKEQALRAAAEERAGSATDALRRLADDLAARDSFQALSDQDDRNFQPYLMLPGDVVQPFSKRITLVYRQPSGSDKILLGSDMWEGDREMEFYKTYRATVDEPGLKGDVELMVTPTPAWYEGDRAIQLALKPMADAAR